MMRDNLDVKRGLRNADGTAGIFCLFFKMVNIRINMDHI